MQSALAIAAFALVHAGFSPSATQGEKSAGQGFAVLVRGDIGSFKQPYGSDFVGMVAVGGSMWTKAFSLSPPTGVSYSQPILEVGGNLYMHGGDVIDGEVCVAGQITLEGGATINGMQYEDGILAIPPCSSTVSLEATTQYWTSLSQTYASTADTVSYTVQNGGELVIDCTGVEAAFVTISSAELYAAWGITLFGSSSTTVVINVAEEFVEFDSLVWSYVGIARGTAIVNCFQANTVVIRGGIHEMTLLAPNAAVTFPEGLLVGTLVASSLQGAGQVQVIGSL